jgi:hypothetical protein
MSLGMTLERIRSGVVTSKEKVVNEPVIRTIVVTGGPVFEAVQKLNFCLKHPELNPGVVFWTVDDDLPKNRKTQAK